MILIPLRHESMQGRRWPVVTFALIGLNIVVFLATHWTILAQSQLAPERVEVRKRLVVLAATHPELKMSQRAKDFVEPLAAQFPDEWNKMKLSSQIVEEQADEDVPKEDRAVALQTEMDQLCGRFDELEQTLLDHYGYVPAHPTAISYVTANFLHAGWLHLIGNMWFLWLAGFILEDNWGRPIYAVFYLIAGVFALQVHGWFHAHSLGPTLGASGAVGALMGAFLVRFPTLKIRMFWSAFFVRGRFNAPAYVLLPLWGLTEVFYGTLFGQFSGVAHWAHVGGFAFGMLGALVISKTGLEQKASAKIDEKVGWSADPAIVQAGELAEQGKVDEAISKLRGHITTKPDSLDAHQILQQMHWRKGDHAGHQEASVKVCQLHLKAHDKEAAWKAYEEFLNTGGEKLPAATWLELCRYLEELQNFDRAVSEYEKLAAAHPKEKPALLASIAAGRLLLKKLGRPADALRNYQAAAASPVPHLDWETNIQAGIKDANAALADTSVPVS